MVETKEFTNLELVDAAWKLLRSTDVKESLPRHYTLADMWKASKNLQTLGIAFFDKYGERLEKLDATAFKELRSWKEMPL